MKYIPSLDGLRAVSILLVLAFHKIGPLSSIIGEFFNGWVGVDVFFVISGYLITSILLAEKEKQGDFSLSRFYTRRWLRIAPAYYFFLAVAGALEISSGNHDLRPFLVASFYLTNLDLALGWHLIPMRLGLAHLWSLALEEQFYLSWPLLLKLLKKHAVTFVLAAIAAVYFWRLYLVANAAFWLRISGGFDTRIDTLMFGVLLAILLARNGFNQGASKFMSKNWIQVGLALLLGFAFHVLGHPKDGGQPEQLFFWGLKLPVSLALVTANICSLVSNPKGMVAAILANPVAVFIGKLSYSIYLWHILVHNLFCQAFSDFVLAQPIQAELYQFILIIGCASLSYYAIERPMLNLKARFS